MDVPATIDYIISVTNVEKLTYVGHSQGTTQMFSAMSKNMDYFKSKLNGFIALGPVANLYNSTSIASKIAAKIRLDKIINYVGIHELVRGPENYDPVLSFLCKWARPLCNLGLFLIADSNTEDEDPVLFESYMSHFPAGASIKALSHFASIMRQGQFLNYDYGTEENMKKYSQATPPPYKLENVKGVPMCLFVGRHDNLADDSDAKWLKETLEKNEPLHFYKEYPHLGHLTFFIPKEVDFLNDIFKCFQDFD